MKFGVAIFPTDYAIAMAELGPAAEELGFESLWVAEHSHIPVSRQSPYPAGGELPRHYFHTMDPFVALTVAAAARKTIRFSTGLRAPPRGGRGAEDDSNRARHMPAHSARSDPHRQGGRQRRPRLERPLHLRR